MAVAMMWSDWWRQQRQNVHVRTTCATGGQLRRGTRPTWRRSARWSSLRLPAQLHRIPAGLSRRLASRRRLPARQPRLHQVYATRCNLYTVLRGLCSLGRYRLRDWYFYCGLSVWEEKLINGFRRNSTAGEFRDRKWASLILGTELQSYFGVF